MIEVYPKYINQDKLEANLNKLVSAFLMVAEDLVEQEARKNKVKEKSSLYGSSVTKEDYLEPEIPESEDLDPINSPLQTSLLSAVRGESKRENLKTLKTY